MGVAPVPGFSWTLVYKGCELTTVFEEQISTKMSIVKGGRNIISISRADRVGGDADWKRCNQLWFDGTDSFSADIAAMVLIFEVDLVYNLVCVMDRFLQGISTTDHVEYPTATGKYAT